MSGSEEVEDVTEVKDSILVALDNAWSKFGTFVQTEVFPSIPNLTDEHKSDAKLAFERDAMLALPFLRDFIQANREALLAGDVDFFRALLPKELQDAKIPPHLTKKGVVFVKVFISIIKDLDSL